MGKAVSNTKKTAKAEFSLNLTARQQDIIFIALIIIAVFTFFWGAITGGGFVVHDNIASESFRPFLEKAKKEGEFPLWIPYIFSGMPSYASLLVTGVRAWDLIGQFFLGFFALIGSIFNNDTARVISYYVLYGIGMYLLLKSKLQHRYIAFFVAISAIFSTYVITWVMIGHNTKPVVFAMFPFIFYFMEKLREKFSLGYVVLLILAVHLMMIGGHLQMIFYGVCAFGIYLLFELISRAVKKEEPLKVLRPAIFLVLAFGIAFLMSADRYLHTREYTPYSTRGSAPIEKLPNQHQDATGGNDYEYATMWSYNPVETFTFLVPSYFGFGLQKYTDKNTKEEYLLSTYWGSKESEDSPPYMGILPLFLAIIGFIFYRRDVFVQFLLCLSIFSLFLSFGKHLPILYDLFYNYVPFFNKFRAPSMALALLHFSVPILAGYGISAILNWRNEKQELIGQRTKLILILSGIFTFFGIIFAIAFKQTYLDAVLQNELIKSYTNYFANLPDFIFNEVVGDWLVNGFILFVVTIFIIFYTKGKVAEFWFGALIIVLLFFDLWRVDTRRMEISKTKIDKAVFEPYRAIYDQIKQDTTLYRIADFSSPHPNLPAYFLMQNINGYHAAKLRIYQDLLDVANKEGNEGSTSTLNNPFLWNLMNVKYIIAKNQSKNRGNEQPQIFPNPTYLPRAFFVNRTEIAKQIDILRHLKAGDFNPTDLAYIEEPLPVKIDSVDTLARAEVTKYKNEYIEIKTQNSGNNLLFISEIYYPAGWKAYIDGKETKIYKTNFAFRSVIVPPGNHTIEFKFSSPAFELGKTLSLITNIVVLFTGALALVLYGIGRKKNISSTGNLPTE